MKILLSVHWRHKMPNIRGAAATMTVTSGDGSNGKKSCNDIVLLDLWAFFVSKFDLVDSSWVMCCRWIWKRRGNYQLASEKSGTTEAVSGTLSGGPIPEATLQVHELWWAPVLMGKNGDPANISWIHHGKWLFFTWNLCKICLILWRIQIKLSIQSGRNILKQWITRALSFSPGA